MVGNNPDIISLRDTYYNAYKVGSNLTLQPVDRIGVLQPDAPGVEYKWDINAKMVLTAPDGTKTKIFSGLPSNNKPVEYQLTLLGQYSLTYTGSTYYRSSNLTRSHEYSFTYYIVCFVNYDPLPKWTVASVIDRALNLAEPHLQSDVPRYKLDPAQRAEFEKIESPEFFFTQKTLKEILDAVGGFIHGIPRLIKGESGKFDTIHYDMLGGTEYARITEDTKYLSHIGSQNIEDYATELDSTVENLVNTLDSAEGSIVDPYAGGFRTTRTEELYVRITDGNMVAATDLPIYSVQKVEVRLKNGNVADITPYVFEAAEYGRLSSYDHAYPTSKAYALYYELGKPNIKGLNFKTVNVWGGGAEHYAIYNIVRAKTDGYEIGSNDYPLLAFRITYTPIFSARIRERKPYANPDAWESALIYNQSANLVETRYYGENIKGAIARMGNLEITRTYRFRDFSKPMSLIPKVGQLWKYKGEDYYVASVTVAAYAQSVDFQVGFSKDFNRLSQYVGINSQWRAYEVSERTAYNRDFVYIDHVIIGGSLHDTKHLLNGDWLDWFAQNAFAPDKLLNYAPTAMTGAVVTTKDSTGAEKSVTLPVVTAAFGNTLCYSFYMKDNYSAGSQSLYYASSDDKVSGYWQTDVPYADYYGQFDTMRFALGISSDKPYENSIGLALPQGDYIGDRYVEVAEGDQLVIDKNGSETLRVNYQVQFVTVDKNIILGGALARIMTVGQRDRNKKYKTQFCVLSAPVGKFDNLIPLVKVVEAHNVTFTQSGKSVINFAPITVTSGGQAWAVVRSETDSATGKVKDGTQEILFASNTALAAGDSFALPRIMLSHKIFKQP